MQRDAYGILMKKCFHSTIPVNVLQMNGVVQHEKLFAEVFIGYKARRIVLMTHMKGSGPHVAQKTLDILREELDYYESRARLSAARQFRSEHGFLNTPYFSVGSRQENTYNSNGTSGTEQQLLDSRKSGGGLTHNGATPSSSSVYETALAAALQRQRGGSPAESNISTKRNGGGQFEERAAVTREHIERLLSAYRSSKRASLLTQTSSSSSHHEKWSRLVRNTSAGAGATSQEPTPEKETDTRSANIAENKAPSTAGINTESQKEKEHQQQQHQQHANKSRESSAAALRLGVRGTLWGGRIIDLPETAPHAPLPTATKANDESRGSKLSVRCDAPLFPTTAPKLPFLDREMVVDSFSKLGKIHQPHFMYRLMPLLCTDMTTFGCMEAICALPNSPFRIEWRREPTSIRTGWISPRSPVRDEIWKYFEPKMSAAELAIPRETRRPPCGLQIDFDGLLLTRPEGSSRLNLGACGLLQMRGALTIPAVEEFGHQVDLFLSSFFRERIAAQVPLSFEVYACAQRYFFLGTTQPVERALKERILKMAKEKGFYVMEQRSSEFQLLS